MAVRGRRRSIPLPCAPDGAAASTHQHQPTRRLRNGCQDLWWRSGDELGEPAQVLGDSGQSELVLRRTPAAQPEATEPEDALEMGEQHLDALAVTTGLLERLRH